MNSKIYPIGVQNFESLRKDDYFYMENRKSAKKKKMKTLAIRVWEKFGSC